MQMDSRLYGRHMSVFWVVLHTFVPYTFSRLCNFVVACMYRRSFESICCYLNNFIVIGKDFAECQAKQHELIMFLGQLGFYVNWGKCSIREKL